jgi:hypothetical protein
MCNYSFAQEFSNYGNIFTVRHRDTSNIEKFMERTGVLIENEYLFLGQVVVKIYLVTTTDTKTKLTKKAVKFAYKNDSEEYHNLGNNTALIDEDELPDLIEAVKSVSNKYIKSNSHNDQTVVTYKSRCGLEFGCFFDGKGWYPTLWLNRYDSSSIVLVKKHHLPEILSLLEKAQSMINEK